MSGHQPVSALKGIGEKTGKLFEKLGVITIDDLISYYPRAYDTYEEPVPIGQLKEQTVMSVASVLSKPPDLLRTGKVQMVSAMIRDLTGTLQLAWFNMPYMRANVKSGQMYVFRGRVVKKRGRLMMEQPEVFTREAYDALEHSMQPVYGQTRGLSNKTIVKAQKQALEMRRLEREYMPAVLRRKYELAEINYALEHIHFPSDEKELLFARRRLVFDEFFMFLVGVRRLKEHREKEMSSWGLKECPEVLKLRERLPYALTGAQERTLKEVFSDMAGGRVMNWLIQGDVGSGKTIIAILALLQAAYNGCQGALMVPTEVLARQHFESMQKLFTENEIDKVPVLVTGSMTAKEKRLAYEKIASHEADIIVGTHALIQEKVVYDRLALVITDEQHRFGVAQRAALSAKGGSPHVLVMSATPIPRTLALIMYGDLDVSVLDEIPPGRSPVETYAVGENMRKRITAFIDKQVGLGGQAYVVCPLIEDSENAETKLKSAEQHAKDLQKLLPHRRVAVLHGRMKNAEKDQIMRDFAAQKYDILVATTVIEVGVDVPNANLMVVEDADRFGLSQLHQLRGRVGRGTRQSYCVFFGADKGQVARERLRILCRTGDGFEVARADLAQRGPGDFFGQRQHGLPALHVADLAADLALMQNAREEAEALLAADPTLAGYPILLDRVQRMFAEQNDEAFN